MQTQGRLTWIIGSLIIFTTIIIPSSASAFSIEIINDCGVPLRIDRLEDNCGKAYINDGTPVVLTSGQSITIENIMPVVHHYKMCANGTCESTAVGMNINVTAYVLHVTLNSNCICVTQVPLVWPGTFRCEDVQFEI